MGVSARLGSCLPNFRSHRLIPATDNRCFPVGVVARSAFPQNYREVFLLLALVETVQRLPLTLPAFSSGMLVGGGLIDPGLASNPCHFGPAQVPLSQFAGRALV